MPHARPPECLAFTGANGSWTRLRLGQQIARPLPPHHWELAGERGLLALACEWIPRVFSDRALMPDLDCGNTFVLGQAAAAMPRVRSVDADRASLLDEWDHPPMREARPERFMISGGSRVQRPAARIERNGARHVPGRPFATFASTVHRLPVYDTRCGAWRIRFEPAAQVFDRPSVCRWLLDLDILVRILQRIGHAPKNGEILKAPLRASKARRRSRRCMLLSLKASLVHLRFHRTRRVRGARIHGSPAGRKTGATSGTAPSGAIR